jgi:hypothetical protein
MKGVIGKYIISSKSMLGKDNVSKVMIQRKHIGIILMCVEVLLLAIMAPILYWRVYWLIGPIESHVLGEITKEFFICVILLIYAAWLIAVTKFAFVKNRYIKVALSWLLLTVSASLVTCLLAPYIISGVP